jgi:hypothetical protein
MLRNVTESQKKRVAGRQRYTCAASVDDYTCPMNGQPFDESGYEIDHIKELREGGTNDLSNLQALCVSCHRVKTSRMTTAISKKRVEPPKPSKETVSERLKKFRYKPTVNLCHHCHDQHNNSQLRKDGEFWFCPIHFRSVCDFLGCLGNKNVHVKTEKILTWIKTDVPTRSSVQPFQWKSSGAELS